MTDIQDVISPKLANAIANPIFPAVDSLLRSGRHISTDQLDNHAFLMDFQNELDGFYRRYNVELIRAPEGFFYLRPKADDINCPFSAFRIRNVSREGTLLFIFKPRTFSTARYLQYARSL